MSQPLTSEQQAFAEKHHWLVIEFMKRYSVEDDDIYGILAQRYLNAVIRYTTEEELQKYAFSTIVWYHLRSELASFYQQQERQMECELDYLKKKPPPEDEPIDNELWTQIEKILTSKQFEAIKLRDAGYSNREIANICGVQRKAIEKRFSRVRKAIRRFLEM